MKPLRALLAGIVDYAGLFPPASLDMPTAVRRYAADRASADRWILGRFVAPASRLAELGAALDAQPEAAAPDAPWQVSAVIGANAAEELRLVDRFNAGHENRARVDAVEASVTDPAGVVRLARLVPPAIDVFIEIPLGSVTDQVAAIRDCGAMAKIRTGGITPDKFPPPAGVIGFLRACIDHRVAFKATAGLHHPVRGTYPLTYAAGAQCAGMYGFLNVFLAAAFMRSGLSDADVGLILGEREVSAFEFGATSIGWRHASLSTGSLETCRAEFSRSFGSCSFREPVNELAALGLGLA